jgi:hypothetical protein
MEYLWDLYSVRITIEMAGGKLIFSAKLPYLARQLLVRKVVPTLTSKSAEIYPRWSVLSNKITRVYPGSGRGAYVQQGYT